MPSQRAEQAAPAMNVTVEEISTVKKTLRVEVAPEVITQEVTRAYAALNRQVRLPGFRPGKAPRALLEQRFAREVEEDLVRKLVPDYYQRALEQTGLEPVDLPRIDRVQIKEGAPLAFSATVEIKPTIELQRTRKLTVPPVSVTVTDAEVEEALGQVQERFAQLDAYEPAHPVANQDFVEMDSVGTVDGQPLPGSEMKGRIIEVGKGVLRPEIEEAILGHRVGDRVEATLALGEDAPAAYRGKTAQFAVTIQGVKRKQLPTIDEELAKDAGVDSLASLRQRLREELERQRRAEGEAEQKQAVLKQLLAAHEFAVPEALVDRELGRLFYRLHPEAHQHEHRHEPDHGPSQQELEQFRATYEPAAVERVKGALLLDAVAADAGLAVTEEEINAEIGLLATQMKTTPEQLRQVLKRQEGAVAQIRRRLLDDKTMSLLVSRATVQNA